jgi:hypothetical protein
MKREKHEDYDIIVDDREDVRRNTHLLGMEGLYPFAHEAVSRDMKRWGKEDHRILFFTRIEGESDSIKQDIELAGSFIEPGEKVQLCGLYALGFMDHGAFSEYLSPHMVSPEVPLLYFAFRASDGVLLKSTRTAGRLGLRMTINNDLEV